MRRILWRLWPSLWLTLIFSKKKSRLGTVKMLLILETAFHASLYDDILVGLFSIMKALSLLTSSAFSFCFAKLSTLL